MTERTAVAPAGTTYTNPVYDAYFADPFVLRTDDAYYAYGTGSVRGGRVFEVLRSTDLATWTSVGGALEPIPTDGPQDCWAPEVVEVDGTYYMYFSIGVGDVGHHLRVATATDPAGPFRDSGRNLTPGERFAIDAHPFRDDDGQWYLYYARDVLEGERVGTTIAVDRLVDMVELAGDARTLMRATADWQLFRRNREMYGQVYDWYTLEGPFVRKRDGVYYLTYSGGSWEETSYGLSFATADNPLGPFTDQAPEPLLLRTVPDQVLGPGHASLVVGPSGHEYVAYHAWDLDLSRRQMCIDRFEWGPDGPLPVTPTRTPQPVPGTRAPAA